MFKKCIYITLTLLLLTGCKEKASEEKSTQNIPKSTTAVSTEIIEEITTETAIKNTTETTEISTEEMKEAATQPTTQTTLEEEPMEDEIQTKKVSLDPAWKYADYSKIHSGSATLYQHSDPFWNGVTVCINAGHGTKGGESERTLCHPDGSPKVTGGTTGAGATTSYAISSGMEFPNGTSEAEATLSLAQIVKEKLLDEGYNVLMIREDNDAGLDNIARTVIANNMADCHIALHYDSTDNDKGAFYMSVPDIGGYREMEPVRDHWKDHHALGEAVISGMEEEGANIFSNGHMDMDLTQTSFSTVPSIDLEVGDAGSDLSERTQNKLAEGIVKGINKYYKKGAR